MARMIQCVKLKKEAEGLDFPPFPGPAGLKIYENVSKEAWKSWLEHQKMLANENRLNMMDPKAKKYLEEQRDRHLYGDGADAVQGYVPKP
jgi:Fe-S cluster biosynthesis and repair protein YggX